MNQKHITTAAYYLAFILLGLTIAAEGPTLLQLAEHTSSALDQISSIFIVGSFGYLSGSYIGGRIYDRVSGHKFMTGVLILLAITIVLVPIATSLWTLLLIILILGLAKGALDVGCNTLLLWVHNEKVGPFMNGLHACFGLGAALAPLVFKQVFAVTGDIHWVYWSFAIVALPIALFIWNLPSPQARAVPHEHKDSPLPIMPVAMMVLCFVLYVGAEVGYGNWIYTYTFKLGLGTEASSADLTAAFWGFFTLGRLFGVWVSTRATSKTILLVDFTGCLASLGLILLFRDSARDLPRIHLPHLPDSIRGAYARHRRDDRLVPGGRRHRRHDPAMADRTGIRPGRCRCNDDHDLHLCDSQFADAIPVYQSISKTSDNG